MVDLPDAGDDTIRAVAADAAALAAGMPDLTRLGVRVAGALLWSACLVPARGRLARLPAQRRGRLLVRVARLPLVGEYLRLARGIGLVCYYDRAAATDDRDLRRGRGRVGAWRGGHRSGVRPAGAEGAGARGGRPLRSRCHAAVLGGPDAPDVPRPRPDRRPRATRRSPTSRPGASAGAARSTRGCITGPMLPSSRSGRRATTSRTSTPAVLEPWHREVEERLRVESRTSPLPAASEVLRRGAERLGWAGVEVPRWADLDESGRPTMHTMQRTYLDDAARAGCEIRPRHARTSARDLRRSSTSRRVRVRRDGPRRPGRRERRDRADPGPAAAVGRHRTVRAWTLGPPDRQGRGEVRSARDGSGRGAGLPGEGVLTPLDARVARRAASPWSPWPSATPGPGTASCSQSRDATLSTTPRSGRPGPGSCEPCRASRRRS